MDINMPIMNGFQTTKYIKDIIPKNCKTKFIALTALDDVNKMAEYKECNFDGFLNKPFDCN